MSNDLELENELVMIAEKIKLKKQKLERFIEKYERKHLKPLRYRKRQIYKAFKTRRLNDKWAEETTRHDDSLFRALEIASLRHSGLKFNEIGKRMYISGTRARQLSSKFERRLCNKSYQLKLSTTLCIINQIIEKI